MTRRSLLLIVFSLLVSCGVLPPQNPVADEPRAVQNAHDASKTVTVADGMVWYNADRTRGLRFPSGTYILEAEDAHYWYFRSPAPLEFRTFSGERINDERSMPGGLMVAKAAVSLVPAGGYVEGEGSMKVMVWKLGGEFYGVEGRAWKKSF